MEEINKIPNPLASTGNAYCCTIAESRLRKETKASNEAPNEAPSHTSNGNNIVADNEQELNYFKSAQWTPDGTTLLTSTADNTLRTFILPTTLLSSPSPLTLTPYTTHALPTPTNVLAPYPHYTLATPTTTLYLTCPTSLPIRLLNTLSPSTVPLSTYTLVSPTTEAYLTPSSLLWHTPQTFLTGTDCLIAQFDIERNGSGPIVRLPTIPSKRHIMKGGGVGIRGIVSALGQQPDEGSGTGILAAGTWTRSVGLYDANGMGGTVSIWNVAEVADGIAGIGGTGITQTVWSPCGRYLCVVERRSRGVLVYDVRVAGKLVAWLEGREADTNQRLGVDVFQGREGMEVWGGGVDGVVRVWEGVGFSEGKQKRSWEWKAHDDPVGSVAMHPSGSVVATCSGQRGQPGIQSDPESSDDDSDNNSEDNSSDSDENDDESQSDSSRRVPHTQTPDNSMKVWSI